MVKLVTQVSLGGGELAPYLYQRSDLNKFKVGARYLMNMHVRAQGGIFNRNGTRFVDKSYKELSTYPDTKFVAFDSADDDTLLLNFSKKILEFYRFGVKLKFQANTYAAGRAGAYSETFGNAGDYMTLAAPWKEEDVYKIKVAQSNDIMTVACEGYDTYELRRYGFYDWGLFILNTSPTISPPTGVVATATIDLTVPSGVSAPTIYNQTYYYVVSAVKDDGSESLASASASCVNDLAWRGNYNTITWVAVSGAVKYNVYKAQNSIYGFIGTTSELTFADRNIAPNLSDTPKTGRNPFTPTDHKPSVVEFHQQRRWFANYVDGPQSFDASGSGAYSDFNVSVPAKADDALSGTIAASKKQDIYWFVPLNELVVLTRSGEWKFVGGNNDGDTITPQSIDARPQSNYGAMEFVKPIIVGTRILFPQKLGTVILDMGYELTENKYKADELSALSTHLFENRTIKTWSYDYKNHFLWIVMTDGKLICYTYHREHELWAATQHVSDGDVLDVMCIPENNDIATYFMVRRKNSTETYKAVERMVVKPVVDVMDSFYVDCGLTYDVPISITDIQILSSTRVKFTTLTGHGFLAGQECIVSGVQGFKKEITSDYDRGINKKFIISNPTSLSFEVDFTTAGLTAWDGSISNCAVRKMVTNFSGFDHLAGRYISVLADGEVYENILVSAAGSFTLERACGRLHGGLPYRSEFQALDIEIAQEGSQGMVRAVRTMHAFVKSTRGLKSSPDNTGPFVEKWPRNMEDLDSPPILQTGFVSVLLNPKLKSSGFMTIRQDYPLPMEILSVTADVEYGRQN